MSVDYKWANAVMDQLKGCQAENARLREEAAAMTTAIQKVEYLESEIALLRLTDEERQAVEAAARIIDAYDEEMDGFPSGAAATLRGLLERLK